MLKRKTTVDEIYLLKKKKRQFESYIEALLKTGDEFADRAEHSRNLTWAAKSNSFQLHNAANNVSKAIRFILVV